jgi:ABC-type arginine/histidine transport system permease subunit
MLKKPAAERLKLLRNAEGKQGQFLWAILRNSFHYAAVHLPLPTAHAMWTRPCAGASA